MNALIIDMISAQGTEGAEVEVEGTAGVEEEGPGGRSCPAGIEDCEVSALDDSDPATREPVSLRPSAVRSESSSDSTELEIGEA